MRASVLPRYGAPELLTVAELPRPVPGPGQILVRVAASAVNPVDLEVRSGSKSGHITHDFPMILGWDLAGVVEECGTGVTRFAPGDQVVAMSAQLATGVGTHAQYVALDAGLAARAPHTAELAHTAALPLAGLTAHQALEALAPPDGGTVLITGAAGAVGGLAVQLAVRRGLKVLAHGRPGDADRLYALGADEAFSSERPVPPGAADGLLETAGLPGAVAGVRDGGRAVSIVPLAPPVSERGVEVRMSFVEQDGRRLEELSGLVDQGVLTLRVDRTYPLAEVGAAHRRLAAGGSRGKLLISPWD
ncbi:NADP-dependent oxidoreductase [Streptomyces albidoflavus]|uniref:NADP-dependent oxidoreductase n=1 Tax=Streptomyces TaxID=1883 RepID=UPI0002493F15|nr:MULTISPECIES: NADP-dependent oxidoreductase [Streptomyces]MCU7707021.1 NADP-dependent oxidoreductase [Streptomyces albidoflavus]RZD78009.1 NADP-dependent oxidoreductase [Streptomyces albidoflavus]